MTVIRHNSISGIVSITAAAGSNLSFYDSAGATLSLDTGDINAGVITATTANFTNATVTGDLTVQGTTTTLDTTVTEVDKLEVGANNTTVGVAITQSGTGDILRLYDSSTQVVTVADGGNIGIGTESPDASFKVTVEGRRSAVTPGIYFKDTDASPVNYALYLNGSKNFVIRDQTNTTDRLTIDSSGRLLVGTSSARTTYAGGATTPQIQLEGTTFGGSSISLTRNSNDANISALFFGKTRGTAVGANGAVANNDGLGRIEFQGNDGTNMLRAAFIDVQVDGTPGVNDLPGRLVFSTTRSGQSSPSERLRISADGTFKLAQYPATTLNTSYSGEGAYIRHYEAASGLATNAERTLDIASCGDPTKGGNIRFFTNPNGNSSATERMRINSSGNLILDAGGDAQDIQIISHSAGSGHGQIYFRGNASGESSSIKLNHYGYADYVIAAGRSGNGLFSITGTDGGTDGILIDTSGRLLVGTSTASGNNLLQVNSNISANGLNVGKDGSNIDIGSNNFGSLTTGYRNVCIGDNTGPDITEGFDNVIVGQSQSFGGWRLTTGDYNVFYGIRAGEVVTTGSLNICIGYYANPSANSGTNQIVLGSNYGVTGKGNNTGFISPNGGGVYQGNNSSSWSTTSDRRLKKNIVDNTEGLDVINQVRVVNFEYRLPEEIEQEEIQSQALVKRDENDEITGLQGVKLGVIAQDLQQVCPDCVKEESSGVLSVVDDSLFWHMVNAVKELSAQNASLEARLTALEAQ